MSFVLHPGNLPTRTQRWAAHLFKLMGWRAVLAPLPGPRGVVIVYPHTSNWDMPIGLVAKWVMGVPFRWMIKDWYFKGVPGMIFGRAFSYWGGVPIERSGKLGIIEQMARTIEEADVSREPYWLAITPEGTRGYRPHWRSGFYHLTLATGLPLGLAYIDYKTRELGMCDYIHLTGDQDADMARIGAIYEGRMGKRHELAAPIRLADNDKKQGQPG
jgi:hypothetical protein